ncbi:conserved Plasmodium protein, unknown function [Plasmodium chabaudi chabaudi]|uniref:Uncharacterized protein n=1 Tax=Plasmodium chabaudi chabaudi TaxID=31271 RepID=A0A4V0JZS7_PLACU|nr:conserved Plasmodium protein, unknown function [Plasmodium chabaudi chabaudi]VTZ66231.1 conserved Plasmodium protein, unknown function [Plasmodium chabaudi chabaudi]|eukprot:XP_735696.2 conserved Plasmodium protein, unknown function [Plasmodium chabaudi chabaudi]
MYNSSNVSSNENKQNKSPIIYKSRAKSLIQKSVENRSSMNINEGKNGTSIKDKIIRLFSSQYEKNEKDIQKTKLKSNENTCKNEKNCNRVKTSPDDDDQTIEWQPVYHETCKIKLPVENYSSTKISLPEDALDDWVCNQNKVSQNMTNAVNNKYENNSSVNKKMDLNCDFIFNKNMENNLCTQDKEPGSKFKSYYNYYLVDEYLDSLAKSQNKNLETTGLDENGQLYDNVSLHIKPIITSKQRLENGVPYDPQNLLN